MERKKIKETDLVTCGYNEIERIRMEHQQKHRNVLEAYRAEVMRLKGRYLDYKCYQARLRELYRLKVLRPENFTKKLHEELNEINHFRKAPNKVDRIKISENIRYLKHSLKVLESNIRDLTDIINEAKAKYPHYKQEKFKLRKTTYSDNTQLIDAVVVRPIQMVSLDEKHWVPNE